MSYDIIVFLLKVTTALTLVLGALAFCLWKDRDQQDIRIKGLIGIIEREKNK